MFVDYRGSVFGIIAWQWRFIAIFTAAAAVVATLYAFVPMLRPYLNLSPLPLGVVGGAIGIFTSFRTNSAYDRWWEGRKLWGQLVNTSRHWTTQVLNYLPRDGEEPSVVQRRLIERHIAYVHALRCVLRGADPEGDEDVARFLKEEVEGLSRSSNPTYTLLHRQLADLEEEVKAGRLDLYRLQLMDESIRTVLDVQGGCERIKKTPFPRGYGFIAERLVVAFSLLFPLGIVKDMGWVSIPLSVLVCTSFLLISEVGRVLEDPFTLFWPALPLSALARTIEINLRERLGEKELPALPKQDKRGILM
jgi:ion channel-forming bestrophin family protein